MGRLGLRKINHFELLSYNLFWIIYLIPAEKNRFSNGKIEVPMYPDNSIPI